MSKGRLKVCLACVLCFVFCAVSFAQKILDPGARKYHNPFKKQIEKIMDMEDKYRDARSYSSVSSESLRQYRAKIDKEKEKLLKKIKSLKEKTQKEIDVQRKAVEQATATNNQSRLKAAQKQLEDREKYMRYIDIWARNEDPYEAEDINRRDLDNMTFSRDGKRRHSDYEEDNGLEVKDRKSDRRSNKKDKANRKKDKKVEEEEEEEDSDSEDSDNESSNKKKFGTVQFDEDEED